MARKFDLTEPNLTKKLARFADVAKFPNCVEVPNAYTNQEFELKGNWAKDHFENSNPITLELACGKGEYTIGQAGLYPDRNFIGLDIKGNRIWKGAKNALENKVDNAAFLRTRIDHVTNLFGENEVSEIWIIFPDPQRQKERKRLTSPLFIDRFKKILKQGGIVQLKTDNFPLFEYTQEVIAELGLTKLTETTDLYQDLEEGNNTFLNERENELRIRTFYEEMWLTEGRKINYIAFTL